MKVKVIEKTKRRDKHIRVTCECGCGNTIDIYPWDDIWEVGGVVGSADEWRELLLPLLMEFKRQPSEPGSWRKAGGILKPAAPPAEVNHE